MTCILVAVLRRSRSCTRTLNALDCTYAVYAWSFQDAKQTRSVTVLELPPVDSPETAVKVAIAAKFRELREAPGNR
jgi:hypothetical protein